MSQGPSFDLLVIGSGGGPYETNLSGYLLKLNGIPWQRGFVCIEGGSGIGALARLLAHDPQLLEDFPGGALSDASIIAASVFSYLRCYLISHAHLDHVAALALSAGTIPGGRRSIFARPDVLANLETIFADRIWPALASWDEETPDFMYRYQALRPEYMSVSTGISVYAMPVSHGRNFTKPNAVYQSTAFFIRNDNTEKQFLFFGDVEPDSISGDPLSRVVWEHAAKLIPGQLDTIFLECSYLSAQPDSQLYGHLSPPHVIAELRTLAELVRGTEKDSIASGDLSGALLGVKLVIIHCKERLVPSSDSRPIRESIVAELEELEGKEKLGISIVAAAPGMRMGTPVQLRCPQCLTHTDTEI